MAGDRTGLPLSCPGDVEGLADWLSNGAHKLRLGGGGLSLATVRTADGTLVGGISLYRADAGTRSAEVGYGVRLGYRDAGIATEALTGLTAWALSEGGLQRIELRVRPENHASIKVADRAGFLLEGTLRRVALEDDGLCDLVVYSRLDTDG